MSQNFLGKFNTLYSSGSQPEGNSPLGENSAFLRGGGIRHCQDLKKNYAQYETETILELMICREPYRTN